MANIALNGNVTADNSVAPFKASRAVDGTIEATHRWVGKVPCSLKLTLTSKKIVNRWVVSNMSKVTGWPLPGWTSPNYNISDYALQGSNDGTNWITLDVVTGNSITTTDRTLATPANYQWYRVYVTKGLKCNYNMASIMDFQLYEAPPTSPYLSSLTISSGTLSPVFNKNTYGYTASVGFEASSIVITPTAEVPTAYGYNATIKVNGVTVNSGSGSTVNLETGQNIIYVDVTSAVGNVTQRYTLVVTRADSNYLSNLVLMNGTAQIALDPTFAPATTSYTASVGYDVSSLAVTATTQSTKATITINGMVATSGQPFNVNNLVVGTNNISVAVNTPGLPVQNYTVVVTRAEGVYVASLVLQAPDGTAIPLNTAFSKDILSYTATIGDAFTSVNVTATSSNGTTNVVINSQNVASGQTVTVNNLVVGSNSITVSLAGDTKTYTITLTRASSPYLSNLVLVNASNGSVIAYTPSFSSTTNTYSVKTSVSSVAVIPTAEAASAVIKVNNVVVASGSQSASITVKPKPQTTAIQVSVTSTNGATYQYTINVSKP